MLIGPFGDFMEVSDIDLDSHPELIDKVCELMNRMMARISYEQRILGKPLYQIHQKISPPIRLVGNKLISSLMLTDEAPPADTPEVRAAK